MAIVDANYKFIYVDIGANGRVSDGGVFDACTFSRLLSNENNLLNVPQPRILPGIDKPIPYYLVADEAFPLTENIMKPYPQRGLSKEKRIFNYRLSRARRIVENVFGILSARFQILQGSIKLSPEKTELIVMTICLLHNFLSKDIINFNNTRDYIPENMNSLSLSRRVNRYRESARIIRDHICTYVNGIGAVPWQDDFY